MPRSTTIYTISGGLGFCCAERVRTAACTGLPGPTRSPSCDVIGQRSRMLQHDVRASWQRLMMAHAAAAHCGPAILQALPWTPKAGQRTRTGLPFWGARSPRACARRTGRDRGLALWLAETGSSRTPHVLSRAPAPQLPLRSQSGAQAGEWLRAVPADSRSSPLTRPMLRPTLLRSRRPQHQLDSAGPSAASSNAAWSRQGPPSTLASGRAHS